jgi:hypothetical protein
MILMAFAAAAAASQWTGPRTEEYAGPGYFCGGGYAIRLARGDRALVLPQGGGAQGARIVLAGREVNIWSGAARQAGPAVFHYRGAAVTQTSDGGGIAYVVGDKSDSQHALRLTSSAFKGAKRDGWFFGRADFSDGADDHVSCLAARSY